MAVAVANYPIHQSPLFKLRSKGRLSALLGCSVSDIKRISAASDNYLEWTTKPKAAERLIGRPSKPRQIQQPKKALADIQKRLADLLARIERPDYLYSATKGRTYIKNALVHQDGAPMLKVDIKAFYTNAKATCVKRFYEQALMCSPDVAKLLTALSVFEGRMLPTGSPLSPIMSYYAYREMFDRLNARAKKIDARFTLYVDDMVFSGVGVTKSLANEVCSEVSRHGLVGHKVRFFEADQPKVVTGVALLSGEIDIPNKRRMKIRLLESALTSLTDSEERAVVGSALIGQYREAAGIVPGIERKADRVLSILAAAKKRDEGKL